jgi:hypothetical protein
LVELHIDTESRIDIIAIFSFCIDIFYRYIGICKGFNQVINFSAQSLSVSGSHQAKGEGGREGGRER